MRLIIFIGHFKTGSTSIQSFLSANYVALLRAGILYPSVESRGVAHNLRALADQRDRSLAGAGLNVVEPHNALALRLKNEEDGHGVPDYYPHLPSGFQMLEMLVNQIDALTPATTILCSEVFALLGTTPKRRSIQRLQNRFAHHEVTIYCNLRRPDEHLSSWHRQRLKFKEKLNRLDSGVLQNYMKTAHFQYAKMVKGWVDHFPDATLVLRDFEDVKASGGSVKDFIQAAGLALPVGLRFPGKLNPSVPCALAEIGRRAIWELSDDESTAAIAWLIKAAKHVEHVPDKDVEVFGATGRKLLSEHFRPVAVGVNELSRRPLFQRDLDDLAIMRKVSDMEAARRALPGLIAHAQSSGLPANVIEWMSALNLHGEDK